MKISHVYENDFFCQHNCGGIRGSSGSGGIGSSRCCSPEDSGTGNDNGGYSGIAYDGGNDGFDGNCAYD